ncbi:MAG TPA: tetratricopeptide repeat protein [Bacteroidia bacterium]|nr:tetratricopeptide repeat protein [Bacteroidia bacterium]
MGLRKTPLFLIAGALFLLVLLFISPHSQATDPLSSDALVKKGKTSIPREDRSVLKIYLNQALKTLRPDLAKKHAELESKGKTDSLVLFWDRLKRPDLASFYFESHALKTDSALVWNDAGNRYYYAVPFVKDQTEMPLLYHRAMQCFDNALAKDKTLLDAKIMLAACYVESSEDPMRGINLLKEAEKQDSNNVKLQMTFGYFSVKSGQLDKALRRFQNVLRIDSAYLEAYLHLADTYEKLGDKENTIRMLQDYRMRTDDPTAKIEIGKYIEQLKNSN